MKILLRCYISGNGTSDGSNVWIWDNPQEPSSQWILEANVPIADSSGISPRIFPDQQLEFHPIRRHLQTAQDKHEYNAWGKISTRGRLVQALVCSCHFPISNRGR